MFDNLKPILKTPSVVDELSGKFFIKNQLKIYHGLRLEGF